MSVGIGTATDSYNNYSTQAVDSTASKGLRKGVDSYENWRGTKYIQ